MPILQDPFGRRLEYLRLSVTDRCNFRCSYCLPDGCPRGAGAEPLSLAEIERLVAAFASLGVWKVRLTGGEPTLRPDIAEIVRAVAATPGIRRVGLTTNGYRLDRLAPELEDAGLTALNVSVDSLDPARFERITGSPRLDRVVAGVEAALAAGIPSVKVNAVLLRGLDDAELDRFLAWTRERPLGVRFIELMQTGGNDAYFRENHLSAEELRVKLEQRGWARLPKDASDGPATSYGHPAHAGRAGLIAPYSAGFCDTCNRVRSSSTGDLRLCLFGEKEDIPLRHLLQSARQERELARLITASIERKPAAHRLKQGSWGKTSSLAVIGG
jgi:cyclic pyranopterin phosphate synthase